MAQSTNGAVSNIQAVYSGEMEMALSQADIVSWSYNGSGSFQGNTPKRSLRALANLFSEKVHIVVSSNSTIKNISDLRGKRVSVGSLGSGSKIDAGLIFNAYGLDLRELNIITMGLEKSVIALEKNKLDAVFFVSGPPVLAIKDLSERMAIRFLSVKGPVATKLTKIFPFFTRAEINMETYGVETNVSTLAVSAVLIVRNDMVDELAYGITKAIWHPNSASVFANGHLSARSMVISNAANTNGFLLHDSARKFYIEQGVIRDISIYQ
jgi:TRAP transporter TAXI family solute receptor